MRGVSERIRQVLGKKNLTEQAIGAVIGVSPQRISQKLKADNWDSVNELVDVADFLGCDFMWLTFGETSSFTVSEPSATMTYVHANRKLISEAMNQRFGETIPPKD